MRRREFINLLGGVSALPAMPDLSQAQAQQVGSLPRFIYGAGSPENDPETQARLAAFLTAFGKLGWVDGRNVRIDFRWGVFEAGREGAMAAEMIRSTPAVILNTGTPMSKALRLETRTVPVVFVAVTDPLGSELVDSMARPGGNLTGFANYLFSFGGKWLQMLKEAAPGIKRVLVILGPETSQQGMLRAVESAAMAFGVQPVAGVARDAAEIESAINAFVRDPNGGLLALPGNPSLQNSDLMVELAARHRLPAMYSHRIGTEHGLMSYTTDHTDLFRRAAFYVDRILKGEKPGDLPVQLPTRYDLVVNLKAAKALGLTIPLTLLASADEVVE